MNSVSFPGLLFIFLSNMRSPKNPVAAKYEVVLDGFLATAQKSPGKFSRVVTGIEALDHMLGNGYFEGSMVTLSGGVSTGKTILGLQLFLNSPLGKKKKGLIITFDEKEAELIKRAKDFNFPWNKFVQVMEVSPFEKEMDELFASILGAICKNDIKFVLVNSASCNKCAEGEKTYTFFDFLIRALKCLGISTIFCYRPARNANATGSGYEIVAEYSDVIIHLESVALEQGETRSLKIVRMRNSKYDREKKEFEIGNTGIEIRAETGPWSVEAKKVVLNIYLGFDDTNIDKKILEKFEKEHGNVSLRFTEGIFTSPEAAAKAFEAGKIDVMQINLHEVKKLAEQNKLLALGDARHFTAQNTWYDNLLNHCSYKGMLYGLPNSIRLHSFFYRKDLYEKYGLKKPETRFEIMHNAKILLENEKDIEYGFYYLREAGGFNYFYAALLLDGNDEETANDKKLLNARFAGHKKAIEFIRDCSYTYHITRKDYTKPYQDIVAAILGGKVASGFVFAHGEYVKQLGDSVTFTTLPGEIAGSNGVNVLRGLAYVIGVNTKAAVYAKELLDFLANYETSLFFMRAGNFYVLSARRDVNNSLIAERPYFGDCHALIANSYMGAAYLNDKELRNVFGTYFWPNIVEEEFDYHAVMNRFHEKLQAWKRAKVYDRMVRRAISYLEENYMKKIVLQEIADVANLSKFFFARIFRDVTKKTVFEYLTELRINRAKQMLETSDTHNITEIGRRCGFKNSNKFSAAFKRLTGNTPSEYRTDHSIS